MTRTSKTESKNPETKTQDSQPNEKTEPQQTELTWYYAPNGLPVIVAEDEKVFTKISEYFNPVPPVYYIQASKLVKTKDSNNQVSNHHEPRMYKVVDTILGWSVSEAPTVNLGYPVIQEQYAFSLPPIPWKLLDRVETFLRLAHERVGTEAIVLLTFDPTILTEDQEYSSDGWGVLVPDQQNSAGHCDYDPVSAHDDRPDQAMLVGSIHSHPNMPAYASSTDHHDQAGFDGVHITYGWYGNGPVEYYIEMTMQNRNYRLTPDQVFEPLEYPMAEDKELTKWVKKVQNKADVAAAPKALNPSTSGTKTGGGASTTSYNNSQNNFGTLNSLNSYRSQRWIALFMKRYTPSFALSKVVDLATTAVVVQMLGDEKTCPICDVVLNTKEITLLRCTQCWNYIIPSDTRTESLDFDDPKAIIEFIKSQRQTTYLASHELESEAQEGLVFWSRNKSETNVFKQKFNVYREPSESIYGSDNSPKV